MKQTFTIQKGIPVPARGARGRPAKYPWLQMKKGDSFFVKGNGKPPGAVQTLLRSCAFAQRPKRFVTRQEETGVRVWRVK